MLTSTTLWRKGIIVPANITWGDYMSPHKKNDMHPLLQTTCCYTVNHYVKLRHARLWCANNMYPLSRGEAQTEKIWTLLLNQGRRDYLDLLIMERFLINKVIQFCFVSIDVAASFFRKSATSGQFDKYYDSRLLVNEKSQCPWHRWSHLQDFKERVR